MSLNPMPNHLISKSFWPFLGLKFKFPQWNYSVSCHHLEEIGTPVRLSTSTSNMGIVCFRCLMRVINACKLVYMSLLVYFIIWEAMQPNGRVNWRVVKLLGMQKGLWLWTLQGLESCLGLSKFLALRCCKLVAPSMLMITCTHWPSQRGKHRKQDNAYFYLGR